MGGFEGEKELDLVMWLICALTKRSISRPYILLRTLKHPTLSG